MVFYSHLVVISAALAFPLTLSGPSRADSSTSAGVEFFEKKVRPVLAEHCYQCHSAKKKSPSGGLRLDTVAGLRQGGLAGALLVPGQPGESLLIKALRYTDPDLQMPPKGQLAASSVADLERWIQLGAPLPAERATVAQSKVIDFVAARQHWAYQPIRQRPPPVVQDAAWPLLPLDRFIRAKLQASNLTPSPPADSRTLLRRVYFDLIGLPPTAEEITTFSQAASRKPQAAIGAVVDRLLASPQYGERWGRHWLDVARYADTKDGVLMFGDNRVRPYAYTYRDYVIRAFNEDTPYDRFIAEQLAADLIEPRVEPWRLGAMGFLTLGRMFDNNSHDVIDDRIDTVTRGLLGLTVACARCHDHKYDAIPTADYYSLYGVFASSETPLELPLTVRPENLPGFAEFEKIIGPRRAALQKFLDEQYTLLSETARQRVSDYLLHVATQPPDPLETAIYFLSLAPQDLRPPIVHRWRRLLEQRAQPTDPVFGLWQALMQLPEDGFAIKASALLKRTQQTPAGVEPGQVNPLVRTALIQARPVNKTEVARTYGQLLREVYEQAKNTPPTQPERRQLLALVSGPDSPAYFPKSQTRRYMSRGETDSFGGKLTELDRLAVTSPQAPPRAMVLYDGEIRDPHVFLRGNPATPGERVPRQFLRILTGEQRQPFRQGSGRLELARAIAARDNPLTARVLVNRVWMHHFGEPLVATPSDFGTRSSPPSHPELLDYLAANFMEQGWSLKKLHRQIILSRTYQQASLDRPQCRQMDPDNRLLWRFNRQRLDLEAMRDTLLFVSGRLDQKMFGRAVNIVTEPRNGRRTIYGLVDRQSLPGLYRTFDFASPDTSAERRPFTTVPQQALFALNSPFLIEQAQALAARCGPEKTPAAERIGALYRLALARTPDSAELQAALRFVSEQPAAGSQLNSFEQLAQVLLLSNEFLFVE